MSNHAGARYSRRSLLKGVAGASALAALPGLASLTPAADWAAPSSEVAPTLDGPIVAYVRDAAKGEVVFMLGTREIVRKDPDLVSRLLSAVHSV